MFNLKGPQGQNLRTTCGPQTTVWETLGDIWHIPLLSVQWINTWWRTDELSETC